MIGQSVEKILKRDWAVIANLVDAAGALQFNRGLKCGQKIRQGDQMGPRRFMPYRQQMTAQHPARSLNQFYSPAIDDSGAKHDSGHGAIVRGFEKDPFGLQPSPKMDHTWIRIQAADGWGVRSGFALDMRKAHEDEFAYPRALGSRDEIPHIADISLGQESSRQRSKKNSSQMDDAVDASARWRQCFRAGKVKATD